MILHQETFHLCACHRGSVFSFTEPSFCSCDSAFFPATTNSPVFNGVYTLWFKIHHIYHPLLFPGAFCLHMQSAECFSPEIFELLQPEAEEEGALPLPKCRGVFHSLNGTKSPPFQAFPHDIPSRRGQVKATWIATDECFVLMGFDFDDVFCFAFAISLEAIQCLVPLAWLCWM